MAGSTVAIASLAVRWVALSASLGEAVVSLAAEASLTEAAVSLAAEVSLTEAAVSLAGTVASLAGAASGSERASLISHRRGDFTTRSVMTSSFSWASTWRHCPKRQWRWFSKKTL